MQNFSSDRAMISLETMITAVNGTYAEITIWFDVSTSFDVHARYPGDPNDDPRPESDAAEEEEGHFDYYDEPAVEVFDFQSYSNSDWGKPEWRDLLAVDVQRVRRRVTLRAASTSPGPWNSPCRLTVDSVEIAQNRLLRVY